MANMADILSQKLGDIKDVPVMPVGTYRATITSIPKIDNFGKNQNLGAEFSFKLTSAEADVDAEELQAAGGIPQEPLTSTFWLTPKALPMLRAFLVDVCGLDADDAIKDALPQTVGVQVLAYIKHRSYTKNGEERKAVQIDGFAKAD